MATPLSARGRRRGFAVLFALAILVLLSVFALSFANLTRLESLAATNVRLQVQAAALAEAGIGQACAEARTAARQRPWVEGTDWWANGAYHPVPPPCERCLTAPPGPPAPTVGASGLSAAPVTCAGCAYCYDCERVNPPTATTCTQCSRPVAPTVLDPRGIVLATNAFGGRDQVQVRSFDVASKLDVNLRTPGLPAALTAIGLTASQANDLIAKRDARGGLRSREELREVLTDAVYDSVSDFLTVYSTPRVHSTASQSGDLPWSYAGAQAPYSPVNVNAASQKVLAAVMAGIAGHPIELQSDGKTNWLVAAFQGERGRVTSGRMVTIPADLAQEVAAEIVACRRRVTGPVSHRPYGSFPAFGGPFRTWRQFELFLQNLNVGADLTDARRALLVAALHPESRAMGYNPDATRRLPGGMFDRMGVTRFTTRFSLGGAGILEVQATGWITDARGIAAAEAVVERVVRVFTPLTFGTQAELEALWTSPNRSIYQSLPELLPWQGATADPLDGHLRLTTEHQAPGGDPSYSTAFRSPDPTGPFDLSVRRSVDVPLRDEGLIAPDGLLTWRTDRQADASRMVLGGGLDVLDTGLARRGSFELWVKLIGDVSIGTDEALVVLSVDDAPRWTPGLRNQLSQCIQPDGLGFKQPTSLGATVKLERFKHRLRVTWFYWGVGGGAISPFPLTLAEVQGDISSWRPGEWHHVMVSWDHGLQDWAAATAGNPRTRVTNPGDGIRMWIDGREVTLDIFRYSALERQAINSVTYHLGKSVSTPMTEGVVLGGYNHDTVGVLVHSTGTPTGTLVLQRYSNSTIDDVFVAGVPYGGGGGSAVPRSRSNRHERNPGDVAARFAVPIGAYARVGAVGVEVEVPNAQSLARLVVGGEASVQDDPAVPAPLFHPADIAQQAVDGAGAAGVLPIAVVLKGDGETTPILESITVNVLAPLQVLEEDRNLP